jgi:hypothetical protein
MNGFVHSVLPAHNGCTRFVFVEGATDKQWRCIGVPAFVGAIPPLGEPARISGWPLQQGDGFTDFIFTEISAP